MNLQDLKNAIKTINESIDYRFNLFNGIDTYILEYNKKDNVWEYYFLDERGGKSGLKTFSNEEKACEYVLHEAMVYAKDTIDSSSDALGRKYLSKPNPSEESLMPLWKIFEAIRQLKFYKNEYINSPTQGDAKIFSSYGDTKKKWQYGVSGLHMNNEGMVSLGIDKEDFASEIEAREYVIRKAISILCEFGDDWIDNVR